MTRRKRLGFVSGACIGMFLLLFGEIVADNTKEPQTLPEKISEAPTDKPSPLLVDETSAGENLLENNGTKLLSSHFAATTSTATLPAGVDEKPDTKENVAAAKHVTAGESGPKQDNVSTSTTPLSMQDGKHSAPPDNDSSSDKPLHSIADTITEGSRFGDNLEQLDKNSDTHAASRELAGKHILAASPVPEGLPTKYDQTTVTVNSSDTQSREHIKSSTVEFSEEKTASDDSVEDTRGSERVDLENAGKSKGSADGISLANDTRVNYVPVHKNGTRGHSETGPKEIGATTENPKEEVEVIENVSRGPLPKITHEDATAQVREESNGTLENELDGKNTTKGQFADGTSRNGNETVAAKIDEVPIRSTLLTTTSNPSLVPRGRTIALSGANEFSGPEEKTTLAGASRDTASSHDYREKSSGLPAKKNTSGEKVDQKPYPYVKSTKVPSQDHTEDSFGAMTPEHSSTVESTSEETYENTISRQQETETKFVVTEPSVVIENSIQQFKSTDKRAGNVSGVEFTLQSQSAAAVTASSATLHKDAVSNGTLEDRKQSVGLTFQDARTTSAENEQKEIAGTNENFDVTGNGITEISPKSNEPAYAPSFLPGRTLNDTTASSARNLTRSGEDVEMSTNVDVQTDPEESLLLRSTLNVTETSTEYPLKTNLTEDTTSATTDRALTNTVTPVNDVSPTLATTAPTFATTSSVDKMNETTSASESQTSTPLATTIEYEFVGLTKVTEQTNENVTADEDHANFTTSVPTLTPLDDITTIAYPTSLKASLETHTEDTTTAYPLTQMDTTVNDETIVTTIEDQTANETAHSTSAISDRSTAFVDNVNISSSTAHGTDSSEATVSIEVSTASDMSTFPRTESSIVSDNNDAYHPNMVTTSNTTQSALSPDVSTTTTTTTTSTSHLPFVPSTLRPRIVQSTWSSSRGPVLAPTESPTESVPNLSPDDIPLRVRIVIEGSQAEVCPHLRKLAQLLAEILNTEADKPVTEKQVIFHQNSCTESQNPAPTSTDGTSTAILVYIVDEDGKFDVAKTKMLPNLYKVATINIPMTIRSFLLVQDTPYSGNAIAVVIVCSVAFICLVLLAGLLFIMRKRQTRFNYGERCRPVSLDAYSLDSVSAYNSVRRKGVARSSKRSYGNPTFEDSSAIPSHPLNFAGLSSFHTDVNAINEEFSGIPQVWAKIDELPPGAEVKNRYANVIPLPETRVPLQRVNNDTLSEYINASYVRGPKNAMKYYIACQAPMDTTVTDFWRMIWEQQSKVIIMLTDLVENGIDKCTEYIPPSEVTDCHRLYGDFQVTLKKRETKEKYAISTLHIKNLENNTFREVFHIWYLWPVNGVQSDGTGLIAILLEARALQRGGPGPIVVHCSPGTGRTGTLIALDLGIRQYEITRTVDVPRVVYTIRRDRAGAVQTKEQYAFIYKALNLYATKLAGGVLEST